MKDGKSGASVLFIAPARYRKSNRYFDTHSRVTSVRLVNGGIVRIMHPEELERRSDVRNGIPCSAAGTMM